MSGKLKLTFTWDGDDGKMSKADARRLLEYDGVTALDFLIDITRLVHILYEEKRRKEYGDPQDTPVDEGEKVDD